RTGRRTVGKTCRRGKRSVESRGLRGAGGTGEKEFFGAVLAGRGRISERCGFRNKERPADPLQSDLGGFDALYDADQGAGAKSRTDGVGEAVYALRTENIGAGG